MSEYSSLFSNTSVIVLLISIICESFISTYTDSSDRAYDSVTQNITSTLPCILLIIFEHQALTSSFFILLSDSIVSVEYFWAFKIDFCKIYQLYIFADRYKHFYLDFLFLPFWFWRFRLLSMITYFFAVMLNLLLLINIILMLKYLDFRFDLWQR